MGLMEIYPRFYVKDEAKGILTCKLDFRWKKWKRRR